MALGLLRTKVADGSVKMAPQRVDGMLTMTPDSLEPGGAMTTTREEPGLQEIHQMISRQLQSLSISKLAPGSLQMAPLRAPGNTTL